MTTPLTLTWCPCGGLYFVRHYRIGRRQQCCQECERCRSWIRINH